MHFAVDHTDRSQSSCVTNCQSLMHSFLSTYESVVWGKVKLATLFKTPPLLLPFHWQICMYGILSPSSSLPSSISITITIITITQLTASPTNINNNNKTATKTGHTTTFLNSSVTHPSLVQLYTCRLQLHVQFSSPECCVRTLCFELGTKPRLLLHTL